MPIVGASAVRALSTSFVLSALAVTAHGQSLEVIGYIGELGEWELTATVAASDSRQTKEFSGPLTMRHVGYCTQDGPEEKTGRIRLHILESSELKATVLVDGIECSYSGRRSDSYTGLLKCPARRAVPLTLWLK